MSIFSSNSFVFFTIIIACFIFPDTAHAIQSDWAVSENTRARILSGVKNIGPEKTFEAAVELELAEGWHTYWKHPGDAGLPPRFEWKSSKNIQGLKIFWPTPKRKNEMDMFTVFAYEGKVRFPLEIVLEKENTDTHLEVDLQLMVCKDICIPEQLKLSLDLDAGDGEISAQQKRIDFAKIKIPETRPVPVLKVDTVVASKDALVIAVEMNRGFKKADIFAYTQDGVMTGSPVIKIDENNDKRAMVKLPKPGDVEDLAEFLSGKTTYIIIKDGTTSIEKEVKL